MIPFGIFCLFPLASVNDIKVYLKHKLSKIGIERVSKAKKEQWLYFTLVSCLPSQHFQTPNAVLNISQRNDVV